MNILFLTFFFDCLSQMERIHGMDQTGSSNHIFYFIRL